MDDRGSAARRLRGSGHAAGASRPADFTYWWRAGHALIGGENPYDVIEPVGVFPVDGFFVDPLPAALVGALFAPVPVRLAAKLFVACGLGLAVFALSSAGW